MSDTPARRFPYILVASLVVNGLLIGLLIGSGLRQSTPPPPDRGERALVRGLERSVSEDQRAAVRQAFRQAYAATRSERRKLRDARRDLRQALAATPYDAEAVKAAFARVRAAEVASQTGLHEELARQFERLTPEQRASVLRSMERRGRRGPRGDRQQRPERQRLTEN